MYMYDYYQCQTQLKFNITVTEILMVRIFSCLLNIIDKSMYNLSIFKNIKVWRTDNFEAPFIVVAEKTGHYCS